MSGLFVKEDVLRDRSLKSMYFCFHIFFVTCVELSGLLKDLRKSQVCVVCIAYHTTLTFRV